MEGWYYILFVAGAGFCLMMVLLGLFLLEDFTKWLSTTKWFKKHFTRYGG